MRCPITPIEIDGLKRVYDKEENIEKARSYLQSRGLEYDDRFKFCPFVPIANVRDAILVFGKDVYGNTNIVEARNEAHGYSKLYQSTRSIPLWGIDHFNQQKHIILTEGAFEAESINQLQIPDVLAVSSYKASFSIAQLYLMMAISVKSRMYTAFNQDRAGIENTQRMIRMCEKKFSKAVDVIETPETDINRTLVKRGKSKLKEVIHSQLIF